MQASHFPGNHLDRCDPVGRYAFAHVAHHLGPRRTHECVDAEWRDAAALIASNGNAPFRRTPQEQLHLDGLRLQHMATEFGVQMICLGIDEAQAAAICGLTEDRIHGLLDCDLSRVSVEEADAAFVTLAQAASNRMGM